MKHWFKISLAFNILIIALFAYLLLFGKEHAKQIVHRLVIAPRHEQKLDMFRACPVAEGAIIFLGNSITEGGNWGELFPDKTILNRGIGGDVTAGVIARMDEIVRHQPSKLFICIGTNDLGMGISPADILENYRAILTIVKKASPQTQIYVQSVLPVGKNVPYGHQNEKILPLNAEIEKLCAEMNITYIDVFSELTDEEGFLDNQFTNDKLHLMGNAYLVWKEKIEPYVTDDANPAHH